MKPERRPSEIEIVMGYSPKSDFWLPIDCPGILSLVRAPRPFASQPKVFPGNAPVGMFVSNCNEYNARTSILRELQQWINVDSYGKCLTTVMRNGTGEDQTAGPILRHVGPYKTNEQMHGGRMDNSPHAAKLRTLQRYPFAVAMQNENNLVEDFVNEKLFDAIRAGAIPIYFGPTNASFLGHDPNDPYYVDVSSFGTSAGAATIYHVSDLAAHLESLLSSDRASYIRMRKSAEEAFSKKSQVAVVRRCLELDAMGTVLKPTSEARYEGYVSDVLCGVCTAVSKARELQTTCGRESLVSDRSDLVGMSISCGQDGAGGSADARGERIACKAHISPREGDVARLHTSCTVCVSEAAAERAAACAGIGEATTSGVMVSPLVHGQTQREARFEATLRCGGDSVLATAFADVTVRAI